MQTVALPVKSEIRHLPSESVPPGESFVLDCGELRAAEALCKGLRQAFLQSSYLPLRHLGVSLDSSRVILRGDVPTFYLKQLAQTTAQQMLGSHQIENHVAVWSPRSNAR